MVSVAPEQALSKYRILVIDDHEDFLETLSYWLQAKGHHVMTAINCEAGLRIIQVAQLDVVFLDMHMPKVDGIETLRRIRETHKDLPVILVTAYAVDEKVKQAGELGISGVFPKDGGFDKLLQVMEQALKK